MNLLLPLIFIFLIFESLLKQYNLITGYEDELLVGIIFTYSSIKYGIPKNYSKLIILFFIFNTFSAYFSEYKFCIDLFLLDSILFLKPFLFFISLKSLNPKIYNINFKFIKFISCSFVIGSFLFLPFHYFGDIFEASFFRFDLPAYQFFYTNPGKFLNIILITGLLSFSIEKSKYSFLFYFMTLVLIISTLRFKGFILLVPIILLTSFKPLKEKLYYFVKKKLIERKVFTLKTLINIVPLGVLFILPGVIKFNSVFLNTEEGIAPRLMFVYTSLEIFISQFPLGIGPGYFGSAIANMFYSPLYVDLGWSDIRGLGQNSSVNYLNDNFWPMIMAQYGFLGFLIVLKMFKFFIYDYLKKILNRPESFLFVFVTMISILTGTFGSATFIGTLGMLYILSNSFLIRKSNES